MRVRPQPALAPILKQFSLIAVLASMTVACTSALPTTIGLTEEEKKAQYKAETAEMNNLIAVQSRLEEISHPLISEAEAQARVEREGLDAALAGIINEVDAKFENLDVRISAETEDLETSTRELSETILVLDGQIAGAIDDINAIKEAMGGDPAAHLQHQSDANAIQVAEDATALLATVLADERDLTARMNHLGDLRVTQSPLEHAVEQGEQIYNELRSELDFYTECKARIDATPEMTNLQAGWDIGGVDRGSKRQAYIDLGQSQCDPSFTLP